MRSMQWQLGMLGTVSAFAFRHRESKKNLKETKRNLEIKKNLRNQEKTLVISISEVHRTERLGRKVQYFAKQ